jgi:N-formylglutamate deformylase
VTVFEIKQGTSPVLLGFPHTGTDVPPVIWERLNDNGRILADTDWHIHRVYDGLLPEVTTVRATFHRYVIDANRDPEGVSLYPGQNTTGLIPGTDFDGVAIWKDGEKPTEADIAARLAEFHAPYHAALAAEIERVKTIHGIAVLYDCHSIRSDIPFLFDGMLPDFNIGTDSGPAIRPSRTQLSMSSSMRRATPASSMAASRAAGRHATTASRKPACMRSRWSWRNPHI